MTKSLGYLKNGCKEYLSVTKKYKVTNKKADVKSLKIPYKKVLKSLTPQIKLANLCFKVSLTIVLITM